MWPALLHTMPFLELTCVRRSDQRDVHTFAHYLTPAPVL
jgi:hypothetical protein